MDTTGPMPQIAKPLALRAVTLLLKAGGKETTARLYVDQTGTLIGAQNIEALKNWLHGQLEYDPGTITPAQVTDEVKRDIRLFTNSPCWFDGCEELRQQYEAEIAEMLKANPNCKGCEKGAVMRKYLALAAEKQKT